MTMRIDTKPLQKALSTVIRAIGSREGVESHVMLKSKGDSLFLTCVSAAMGLTTRISVRSDEDVSFTLPARKLYDIARKHGEDDIWTVRLDGTKVRITVARARYVLHSLSADDFPKPEFIPKDQTTFIVDSGQIADLITSVMPSAAKTDVRVALNSINFTATRDTLSAVATDGHRLSHAVRSATVGATGFETLNIILPRAVASEIASLGAHEVIAAVAVKDHHFQIKIGDTFLTARAITDKYPDWKAVMPKSFSGEILIDRERFESLLKSVSCVVDEKKRSVFVRAASGSLTVETPSPCENAACVSMDIEEVPCDLEAAFNIDYLLDAVSAIQGDAMCMKFGTDNQPSMVHAAGTEAGLRTIIMPVRA